MTDTKTCTTCGQTKPYSEFHKGSGKGGRRAECAACMNRRARERRRKAREARGHHYPKVTPVHGGATPTAEYPADSILNNWPIDPDTGRPANYWKL